MMPSIIVISGITNIIPYLILYNIYIYIYYLLYYTGIMESILYWYIDMIMYDYV